MADKKISQLTAATTPLAGTEVLPIVQSGSTVKVSSDDLTVKNVRSNATSGILQVAGPGAGTTRVMTTPNANFTVARTDAGQTFTGNQVVSVADNGGISITQSIAGETGFLNFVDSDAGLAGRIKYDHSNNSLQLFSNATEQVRISSGGNLVVNSGAVVITNNVLLFDTDAKGINDANGNELLNFSRTASAVNEFTIKNAATGGLPQLAVTGGDTNIGMDLAAKGSGGFAFNGASRRFVRTGTNADTTVAATISFVSQGNDWISQLVEFRVALSSSLGSSVHGGVVRYILSSLDSGSGLASITALASDLTGVTAATSSSGNDFTVTFTITGGGNAIRYGIQAEVLSSNGAGWYATGMSVA
jgi:hypothetical protein